MAKNNQKNNKTVPLLSFLVVVLFALLIISNLPRIMLAYHELTWRLYPDSNPAVVEKLLQEKIQVKIRDQISKDPNALEKIQNINRKITVYFKTNTPLSKVNEIIDALIATNEIEDTKYISQQDAYNAFKETIKNDQNLLDMTTPDMLPISLDILVKDARSIPEIKKILQQYKSDIDDILDNTQIGEQINSFLRK